LTSKSDVNVRDQGASAAQSGAAWAVAPSSTAGPAASPSKADSSPTPANQSGYRGQNTVADTQQTDIHVSGGPNNRDPILVAPSQVASVDTHGVAVDSSAPVCSAGACANHGAASGTGTRVSTGASTAQGLAASNQVNTNATTSVHIGGENFAPITILVDAITQISNVGVASSSSGDATAAAGAPSATHTPAASSGAAHAVGSQVVNHADIRSMATVQVSGDNYSPINLILNLAAQFVNWGIGVASSGDASASTGAASATGLQVSNLVNMWASASVDIDGNNYAPIVIEVHFNTLIDNTGVAAANSGAAAAGAASSSAGSASAGTPNAGTTGQSRHASGGSAVAIGSTADVAVTSNQVASANAGKLPISATVANALRNLPSVNLTSTIQSASPDGASPAPVAGVSSTSGNSVAAGLHSAIDQTNTQLAGCTDPGVACVARNTGAIASVLSDLESNPALPPGTGQPGGTSALAGGALVDATPTPTTTTTTTTTSAAAATATATTTHTTTSVPADAPSSSGQAQQPASQSAASSHQEKYYVAAELSPSGYVTVVDPWDAWPTRWLPPMPDFTGPRPFSSTVSTSLDTWPAAGELPLPNFQSQQLNPTWPGGASGDVVAESPTTAEPVPLMSILDVEAVDHWPDFERMPMPGQAARYVTLNVLIAPGEPGVTSVEFGPATLIPLLFGGLGGSRQGRQMLWKFARKTAPFVASIVALVLFMGRI
jgi:hypothetical protein